MTDASNGRGPTLAVIPSNSIENFLKIGYTEQWLKDYFNPLGFFGRVYLLSLLEKDNPDLLGMTVFHTEPAELSQRIKELGVDIVRAYAGFWPCDMACGNKAEGVPVVVSVHDTNPKLLHDSVRRADFVWGISEGVKKLILTKFNHPERVWWFTNRVNFEEMRPLGPEHFRDLEARYPFKYRILHVGRKTEQKNLETLIRALRVLGPDYCLLAVGKGDGTEYRRIAEAEGVSDRCFFIESIRNDELARYTSWSTCFCMPSRWEGFGIAIIEALACGAVMVASDIPVIAEAIRDGENGLLVKDFENPSALAGTLKRACEDASLRQKIQGNARKSAEPYEKGRVDRMEVLYYEKALKLGPLHRPLAEKAYDRLRYIAGKVMR